MSKPFLCIAPVYALSVDNDTKERFHQNLIDWGLVKKEVMLPGNKLGDEFWQILDESLIAPVILKLNQRENNNKLENWVNDPRFMVWLHWSSLYAPSNIVSDLIYPESSWSCLDQSLHKKGHEVTKFIWLPPAEIVKEWSLRQVIAAPQLISSKIKI